MCYNLHIEGGGQHSSCSHVIIFLVKLIYVWCLMYYAWMLSSFQIIVVRMYDAYESMLLMPLFFCRAALAIWEWCDCFAFILLFDRPWFFMDVQYFQVLWSVLYTYMKDTMDLAKTRRDLTYQKNLCQLRSTKHGLSQLEINLHIYKLILTRLNFWWHPSCTYL